MVLFYEGEIPPQYLLDFLCCGEEDTAPGPKLLDWEQEYYRANKSRVDLKKHYSAEELEQQAQLKKLLDG